MRRRPAKRLLMLAGLALALSGQAPAAALDPGPPAAKDRPGAETPRKRPKRPRVTSSEFRRSWGLATVNAAQALRTGASGRGVTIALIDCGLQEPQPEVAANVSPLSIDVVAERKAPPLGDRHGAWVAGPLGSAFDRQGLLGVAYNATLLAIRADMDGGFQGLCAFRRADLAKAVDYAVERGAKIIVLPVQTKRSMGPAFEAALQRAADAGAVAVVAAGNGAMDNPTWPGRYAADPRFAGAVVAVGAVGYDGVMTDWSNRAGEAQSAFVAAPGERVITDCGRKVCTLVSGTSFATPYVAGALALVMEAQPELTGRQAVELVLRSARDAGPKGVDPIYGRGVLDVGRAVRASVLAEAPKGPG